MIKAFAVTDIYGASISISVVNYANDNDSLDGARILRIHENGRKEWEPVEEGAYPVKPTFQLGVYEAFAIADALAELRTAVPEVRALRSDYIEERRRVDRLIEALIEVAKG